MMALALATTLIGAGILGGFSAGLLGVGGGVLMFPLLYYLPPWFGIERMDAKTVAAIVVSQVFFSTLTGGIAHIRSGRVQRRIALIAGSFSATTAFAGSIASKWASERFLLVLFGVVTIMVVVLMILPVPVRDPDTTIGEVEVREWPLAIYSSLTGVVIGFLGAGNFIFVPILIYLLYVPTKIAIGTNLIVAVMSTASGFVGKLITGQVPFLSTLLVVAGAVLGAWLGEHVHRRLSSAMLRRIYAVMVGLIACKVWLTILGVDE
jgi:hypothetical protein